MDRIKIGMMRVNLNLVTHVQEFSGGDIYVYLAAPEMNSVEITGQAQLDFAGDEAKLFLAIWDGDDEEEARLWKLVNPTQVLEPAPVKIQALGMTCPECGAVVSQEAYDELVHYRERYCRHPLDGYRPCDLTRAKAPPAVVTDSDDIPW